MFIKLTIFEGSAQGDLVKYDSAAAEAFYDERALRFIAK